MNTSSVPGRLVVSICAIIVWSGCASSAGSLASRFPEPGPCRTLLSDGGAAAPLAEPPSLTWHSADDDSLRRLAAVCTTVGPSVHRQGLSPSPPAAGLHEVGVVSWNAHVGGGDLLALVGALREGTLSADEPMPHFVLLVQEAFRSGPAVPQVMTAGVAVPARIVGRAAVGRRIDVVTAAERAGLHVFYVPSMRNGSQAGESAEDRGNAILSTLPLSDLTAIELPYARQRRVAAAATVSGTDASGERWHLRVVSAHLDATAGARSLWLFSSGLRLRQAEHLLTRLDRALPTVVGSDLNTWAGGRREPAAVALQRAFPQTGTTDGATFRFGLTLDYVFARLPERWRSETRILEDHFGSDHRPLLARVRWQPEH